MYIESGDDRANHNGPNLLMLHTIWLREHNRVAQNLVSLIPGRTDEFYFQEARRIVIAEYQHITFTEFLPALLGDFSFTFVNKLMILKGLF